MHGNEPAGIRALKTVFELLEREQEIRPEFRFHGRLVGLVGNMAACQRGVRFIGKDLNRQWDPAHVDALRSRPAGVSLEPEDTELLDLLSEIEREMDSMPESPVVLLDLHTTSASGGIFAVATDDPESLRIAKGLHVPVITGMLRGLRGTTLHFFSRRRFGRPLASAAFEAGQHGDPLSVNRTISAVINCMRSIGNVRPEDVETRHDELLRRYARALPTVAELVYSHRIAPGDAFVMQPGYRNFQAVEAGEWLATDRNGPVRAPAAGLVLMPLYQPQGCDGFFLVRPKE
jgi:succinylglutamate desuccinylase